MLYNRPGVVFVREDVPVEALLLPSYGTVAWSLLRKEKEEHLCHKSQELRCNSAIYVTFIHTICVAIYNQLAVRTKREKKRVDKNNGQ